MSWSFDASLSTDLDKVRLYTGDTNTNSQLLANETIQSFLTAGDSVINASIKCCRFIIAKLARDYDRSNVGMSASRSQQIQHYRDLIVELTTMSGSTAACSFGGLSYDDAEDIENDTDYKAPLFTRERHDNNE